MSCAYLYVHNFPRTHVSRFGRKNLAFDKETAEATGGNDEIYPPVAGPVLSAPGNPGFLWSLGWFHLRPVNLPAEVKRGKHQPERHIRDAGHFFEAIPLTAEWWPLACVPNRAKLSAAHDALGIGSAIRGFAAERIPAGRSGVEVGIEPVEAQLVLVRPHQDAESVDE